MKKSLYLKNRAILHFHIFDTIFGHSLIEYTIDGEDKNDTLYTIDGEDKNTIEYTIDGEDKNTIKQFCIFTSSAPSLAIR